MAVVLAGHGLVLGALFGWGGEKVIQPPEVLVMAQVLNADPLPASNQAAVPAKAQPPAPSKDSPKPKKPKPKPHLQPVVEREGAAEPNSNSKPNPKQNPKPSSAVDAPSTSSTPSTTPSTSSASTSPSVATAATVSTSGERAQADLKVKPTLVGASSDLSKDYPALSVRLGEEGQVVLLLQVGADGSVLEASVLKSSGYVRLDAQALKSARAAHFRPGSINGQAVPMPVKLPIKYEIKQ